MSAEEELVALRERVRTFLRAFDVERGNPAAGIAQSIVTEHALVEMRQAVGMNEVSAHLS